MRFLLPIILSADLVWGSAFSSVTHRNQHAQAIQPCNEEGPELSSFLQLYDSAVSASCVGGACASNKQCGHFFCIILTGHVPSGGAGAMKQLTDAGRSFLQKITKVKTQTIECPNGSGQEPFSQTTMTTPTLMYFQRYPTKADRTAAKDPDGYLELIVSQHESEVACDVINAIFSDAIGATGVGGIFGDITQLCQQL